jgi:Zn finger protein HypA/HybF involved in hydrogenase expression
VIASGVSPDEILAQQVQRQRASPPEGSVHDPDRRRKNILAKTADAPDKESVRREQFVQVGITEVTAQAKAYLRAKYKNSDGLLVCQCCHEKMPFKLRSGEHYFEAVQCIEDKETRHFQNRLALCPTCAAMYQHVRDTEDAEIRRLIIKLDAEDQAPAVEIPVRLAGREYTLRFVGTHWFDLKTILSGNDGV